MKIDSVLILAAGIGSRLKPYTNDLPKSLLPLGDTNILRNLIEQSVKFFTGARVYVNASYLAEKIIWETTDFPLTMRPYIIWEKKPLGPSLTVKTHCNNIKGNVLVLHGDNFFSDSAFSEFANSVNHAKQDVSILLCHQRIKHGARSMIIEKDSIIKSIFEITVSDSVKNSNDNDHSKLVWSSSGALVIKNKSLLNFTPEIGAGLSPSLINYLASKENLYLEKCNKPRISIDDEKSYSVAVEMNQKNPRLFDRTI